MTPNAEPLELVVSKSGPEVELVGLEVKPLEKIDATQLLARIEVAGDKLREMIVQAKRIPRATGLEPHQDPTRSLSLAQAHLQTGFMWLRRAVEQPKGF